MRKKCKRKVWKLINPIKHAIDGASICTDETLAPLQTRELAAIEAFRIGKATIQEWSDIVNMMNVTEHMAFRGVGPEAKQCCHDVYLHLIAAAKRYKTTRKMGTTGEGLQCFRDLYEWHNLQRTAVSRSEYERHIQETVNRIRSGAPEVIDAMEVV